MTKISTVARNSGTSSKLTVVFFGSGPVAAASLTLLSSHCTIEAVVTKPRPLHHKGPTEVIELAEQLRLPVICAENKASLSAVIAEQNFTSQVAVLIDFGIIVTQDVIESFPLGIVNSHFSLLPDLRGADPITFSILSGQKQTGVSLMLLVEAMDEGPLLAVGIQELDGSETTPALTDRLIKLSDALLKKELPRYISGESRVVQQAEMAKLLPNYPSEPTYSRKLTKEDGVLDFTKPADQLEREVRAFIGWPKSRTLIAGKEVIVTAAHAVPSTMPEKPGHIEVIMPGVLMINTTNGYLCIDKLKPAGKNEMPAKAFLAGHANKL